MKKKILWGFAVGIIAFLIYFAVIWYLQYALLFGMGFLGLITYYFFALQKFHKETPVIDFRDTFKKYFRDKIFAFFGNICIILTITILIAVDPTGWYVRWITSGALDGSLPAHSYFVMWLAGIAGQGLLAVMLGARNPIAGFEKKEE